MLKILIAEDDRELRQLFSHVLTRNGYAVKGVSNGKEALDAMDNDYFDLVITDIMMQLPLQLPLSCVQFPKVSLTNKLSAI